MTNQGKVTTFKERFADLLADRPESDTDLADKLNVSKQTVSAWKLGIRHPNKMATVSIAKFFGVSIDWLYGFDVPKYVDPKHEEKMAEQPKTTEARILATGIDKLPKEQREQALNVIKAMFAKYSSYFEEDNDET